MVNYEEEEDADEDGRMSKDGTSVVLCSSTCRAVLVVYERPASISCGFLCASQLAELDKVAATWP